MSLFAPLYDATLGFRCEKLNDYSFEWSCCKINHARLSRVVLKERIILVCFLIFVLLSSFPAYSTKVQSKIIESLEPNSITIIGETHKQPESIQFFLSLVTRYLQQGKCLFVALEIASSQQAILEDIVKGTASVSDIQIATMIDHPPFRTLIDDLAGMRRNGNCLKLIAIDAALEMSTNRDEWMAKMLADHINNQAPVLALLGSLHALKKVDWNIPNSKVSPYVAEILASQGHRIRTYPQIWLDRVCNTRKQLISSDEEKATRLINNELISLLNAFEFKSVNDVVDGVVIWQCS